MLEQIEALREEIEERIAAIENGDYFEDREPWEDDYDEENPDYVTEEQADELNSLFLEAGALFLDGQLESARRLYLALFDLMDGNEHIADHFPPGSPTFREARARLCRCVYETADPVKRMDDFFDSMKVNATLSRHRLDLESEPFPMVQDVIDARPGELGDWESFLLAWEQELASYDTSRAVVLRMEALAWLEGIDAVSRLAREWQSRQPYGTLFWIQRLEINEDWREMLGACQEALEVLPFNSFREQAAEYLVTAAIESGGRECCAPGETRAVPFRPRREEPARSPRRSSKPKPALPRIGCCSGPQRGNQRSGGWPRGFAAQGPPHGRKTR